MLKECMYLSYPRRRSLLVAVAALNIRPYRYDTQYHHVYRVSFIELDYFSYAEMIDLMIRPHGPINLRLPACVALLLLPLQQEKLIRRLDQEFLACARRYGLPLGDFPKVRTAGMSASASTERSVLLHL